MGFVLLIGLMQARAFMLVLGHFVAVSLVSNTKVSEIIPGISANLSVNN
jgi:hypothetical protein